MATNIDAPFGFMPVDTIGGAAPGKLGEYKVTNDAIFQGDSVQIASNSGVLTQGGADTTDVGVFWGAKYDDSNGKPTFTNNVPASQAATAFVYDNPYQVFEIQGDDGTNSAQTDVGRTADKVVGQGSTANGVSIFELDSSDIGTGANLRIVGFSQNPNRGNIGQETTVYRVLINEHTYAN